MSDKNLQTLGVLITVPVVLWAVMTSPPEALAAAFLKAALGAISGWLLSSAVTAERQMLGLKGQSIVGLWSGISLAIAIWGAPSTEVGAVGLVIAIVFAATIPHPEPPKGGKKEKEK